MKNFIKKALSLNSLRKKIGFDFFWRATKEDLHLEILSNPDDLLGISARKLNILVLSPHPDDDVFGIGGTIAKFHKNGDKITVLYFCDGSKGTDSGIRDSSLITKRKKEVELGSKILGINDVIFWGYKDGQLEATKTAIKAFANLIKEINPDIVFLPSTLDNHPDHYTVNEIFYNSLFASDHRPKNLPPLIAMYEIWTPLFPNRLINITDMIENKNQAIMCHKSQLKSRGYDKAIISLNQYRAEVNGIKGYAEALFVSSPEVYKKLFELTK
jgi:LmbE family N-acetylglucosaminyl deacetylase